jgi:hypothetical protein
VAGPAADPKPPGQGLTLAELATAAQAPQGMLAQAAERGLLPAADAPGGRWSPDRAQTILDRWPQTAAVQAARALGATRCAGLLSRLTGLSHPPGPHPRPDRPPDAGAQPPLPAAAAVPGQRHPGSGRRPPPAHCSVDLATGQDETPLTSALPATGFRRNPRPRP